MAIHTAFIRAFLKKHEGRELIAYIPCRFRNFTGRNDLSKCGPVIGSSGVTVGSGLDLGQQNMADLDRMGLDLELVALFCPYLGKKRDVAIAVLSANPLTLTNEQCDAVDAAVHADYIRRAAIAYDQAMPDAPFALVPSQAQAVIVSLFYQLGAGVTRYPRTWRFLLDADWEAAARELESGFTRFAARRADEARLLREIG